MKISVIITTYNSEEWLKKVLFGYLNQTETDFEVVIADDGSTKKTQNIVIEFSKKFRHEIIHVWQEDDGFQKCKILNKAILKTNSDYILFTDGDCIPRNDFVATHLFYKENGFFLSGGYFKLPIQTSNLINECDIYSNSCFNLFWLIKNGVKANFKITKLIRLKPVSLFMNWITPTKKTFNGHNTSCFKHDLISVNGFNENMQYGGLDREIGERLFNFGIRSKQIRYTAICLHLEHDRSYYSSEKLLKNLEIRSHNIKNNIVITKNGINQYE
jgi:glycosyltransferase involved in cell wall biosynthesis